MTNKNDTIPTPVETLCLSCGKFYVYNKHRVESLVANRSLSTYEHLEACKWLAQIGFYKSVGAL